MPKLGKQKAHLREARLQLSKKQHKTGEVVQNPTDPESPSVIEEQPTTSGLASHVQDSGDSCSSDSDFDPEEALINDPAAMIEDFTADWVASLPRDDLYALSLLIFQIIQQEFLLLVYPASKIIGKYLNKNYKTVQKWRVDFLNQGEVPDFIRGKYERMNAVANDEDLTEEAWQYVHENGFKRGAPNMTS